MGILLAFDFWTVKNVTGRLLVGLRWWNEVDDEGGSNWVFETIQDESVVNATDRTVFWGALYAWPVIWAFFLFMNMFSFNWLVLIVIALVFACSNLVGYWKCSKDASKRMREWA